MKIFMLGDGGSSHIQKWVSGLAAHNVEVGLFSLHHFDENIYKNLKGFSSLNNPDSRKASSLLSKLYYLKNTGAIKKQLANFKPDILHAHYATSYGLLASKTKFHPLVISVWGSDVYDFPKSSALHKKLLKSVLSKADIICSTSHCMKEETLKYVSKKTEVVPFGVDTDLFATANNDFSHKKEITIGIIKSLEKKYGIEFLIKAFHETLKINPDKNLRLLIVGEGSKKSEYQKLCGSLGISDKVIFTGRVNHNEIVNYHRQIDIFVSLSILDSESFGVSLAEAMSCGKPVVASDVAGFKEVLGGENCGILVPKNTFKEPALAINQYLKNPQKAIETGTNARKRVLENYDWKKNLERMLTIYKNFL
jgi:glycosyltransferase involved in cell wall biosynthesis